MLRMVQSNSAGHAKAYFSDALLKSDYYLNDQELQGHFHGRLAERMGIKGPATKETFFALCENRHPVTGQPLTPRTKQDRITGYDINFHCPKSLSVVHSLSKDDHILNAFRDSVNETMLDIEADTKTRVRKGGRQEDRATGELVWAEFVHQTARPVEDHTPDPHLHAHCFVKNVTWDEEEKKFKAGKFRDIKRDMPFYQARFHKRLADKLAGLGYNIKPTSKSFELDGVPKRVIDLFSKRTDEIGRIAKEKGITDAKGLDALGARTRAKKQKGFSMAELKDEWRQQIHDLGPIEKDEAEKSIRFAPVKDEQKITALQCVNHAIEHCFERASVMSEKKILETAYKYALGSGNVSVDDIAQAFQWDGRIIRIEEGSQTLCTTKQVLTEERHMVELARKDQGKLLPVYQQPPELPKELDGQQADAIRHALTTTNRIIIIRGGAGTGKTTVMAELNKWVEKAGYKMAATAPTAQAAHGVLKQDGFQDATTLARLLVDKSMQDELAGQFILVDEAGLLGTKDMTAIIELAVQKNARLILCGDTRQHAAVVRGDALRILNKVAGIKTAEVSKIFRQRSVEYRAAVEDLAKGKIGDGFEKLDTMGAVKTIDPAQPNSDLVNDYIKTIKKGKTALVISPTHRQGDEVTDEIRLKLRQTGMIGKKELLATRYSNLNLTQAEKADWRNFEQGQIIQFNQNLKGINRGSIWTVKTVENQKIQLQDEQGKTVDLPQDKSAHYDVFEKTAIGLSKGDKVQVTRNSFDKKEKRMNNGMSLDVQSVSKNGKITLYNKANKAIYELDKDFGHLSHAHCITSHSSQGKTVDEVFIAQPSATFPATDAKQFYVSVSRARDAVTIYTDDKEALLDYASEMGDRQSATELVANSHTHSSYVEHLSRSAPTPQQTVKNKQKKAITKQDKERDYEPLI